MSYKQEGSLKRSLNPMNVWAIAFGCVIGWGSFVNPGKKFLPNSGVAGTAIAMILAVAERFRVMAPPPHSTRVRTETLLPASLT